MAVPSQQTKMMIDFTLADYLDSHQDRWPQVDDTAISWRGACGYLTAVLTSGQKVKLARITYTGGLDDLDFALYDPATDSYTPARIATGAFTGTIVEVFQTTAIIHLADHTP